MRRTGRAVGPAQALRLLRLGTRAYLGYRWVVELSRWAVGTHRLGTEWISVPGILDGRPLRLQVRSSGGRGDGRPPVVLVAGFAIGTSYLMPLAGALAKRSAVHAPDLLGHGRSDHDARPLTFAEHAAVLAGWMRGSGLTGAVVVAHSTGCQIAAELARSAPDLVAGLVLIGPTSDARARTVPRQLARGAVGTLLDGPSYLLWSLTDYVRSGPAVLRAELREMVEHRIEEVLPALRPTPVRVVRGALDIIVPKAWAATVASLVGAPPPVSVPRWAHTVHYDSPRPVARVVEAMLDEIAPAGGRR